MTVAQTALLAVLALLYTACGVQAGRILVAPTPRAQSHLMNMEKISEELITQRGHEIMVSHRHDLWSFPTFRD